MKMLLTNIALLLIYNNSYAIIRAEDYTGLTNQFYVCDLPIDFIISGTCVFTSFGLWIIIVIVFGVLSAIFRR